MMSGGGRAKQCPLLSQAEGEGKEGVPTPESRTCTQERAGGGGLITSGLPWATLSPSPPGDCPTAPRGLMHGAVGCSQSCSLRVTRGFYFPYQHCHLISNWEMKSCPLIRSP